MSPPFKSELGKTVVYDDTYNPKRLFAVPRAEKRAEIGINSSPLPFFGFDLWHHYEVSWLNEKGKPVVALAKIQYDCASPFIVESKSLKLYFNSFNQTQFATREQVETLIKTDLAAILATEVFVGLMPLSATPASELSPQFEGDCLDELDIECNEYLPNPDFLCAQGAFVQETLHSNLLKSNCLITEQPDWGSVQIQYHGSKMDRAGLLRYIVSFRNHNEFHEQCIERMFMDIFTRCQPKHLTICGHYTRRGGLDINPYRSTDPLSPSTPTPRLVRQ